eukprot:gene34758-42088_t
MPSTKLSPEKSMTPENSSSRLLTLRNFSVLGDVFKETGKLREAEDLYRSGLQGREKALGRDHPETLTAAHNLALILEAQRKFSDAEELFRSTIEARQRVFGKTHPATCSTAYCLGDMLRKLGRKPEAVDWIEFALQGYVEFLGEEHANTKLCRRVLKSLRSSQAS